MNIGGMKENNPSKHVKMLQLILIEGIYTYKP